VVVSSDGGVDFIPDPRPAIRRSQIDEAIGKTKSFKGTETTNRTLYRSTLDWLDDRRFYLTEADCNTLNPLVEGLEERIKKETQTQLWIVREPFAPRPGMNDELYYLKESQGVSAALQLCGAERYTTSTPANTPRSPA
jgi:hypothetical protein